MMSDAAPMLVLGGLAGVAFCLLHCGWLLFRRRSGHVGMMLGLAGAALLILALAAVTGNR